MPKPINKVAELMALAGEYARAYHKWHGEDPEEGDCQRLVEWRQALNDALAEALAAGVPVGRKCLYCERDMIPGSECLSKAQSESCDMRAGVAVPEEPKHG